MTAHASDPDGGDFTFALAPATTPFTISATTGVITVSTPSAVDREVNIKMFARASFNYSSGSVIVRTLIMITF